MKKFLCSLLLILATLLPAQATDITITAAAVPYANITDIGTSKTGVATVTNLSTSVTLGTALPSNYVGISGYQIKLGSTHYYVTDTVSTTVVTLDSAYASTTGSVAYEIYPFVLARVFVNRNFIPLGASYVVQSGNSTTGTGFFKQFAATYRGGQLYLPEVVLQATTDVAEIADRDARYTIWFYRLNGSQIRVYDGFQSFRMPHANPSTTWPSIKRYNTPATTITPNFNAYNTDQSLELLDTIITATPEYILKADSSHRAEDSGLYQTADTVVNTLKTDMAGGVPVKTASEIAATTAGNKGREFFQSDGIPGLYRDYGTAGIRRVNSCVSPYDIGIVPNSSGAASANQTAYNTFHSSAATTGACIQFPEGNFYFTTGLANTKPMQVIGAGSSFTNQSSPYAGTTIIVNSGSSGITFSGQSSAKGGRVENLNLKTASGFSGQSTGNGIWSDATITIRNVAIEGFAIDGIQFVGSSGQNTDGSVIDAVYIFDIKRDGLHLDGGGDTNVIKASQVNVTRAGRHGIYNAGNTNTFINPHVAFSAQVTAGSKDYYEDGNSNTYINPYAEAAGSEYLYLGTNASYTTVETGDFGAPTIQYANSGVASAGHRIVTAGQHNEIVVRDKFLDGSGKTYSLVSGNLDASGGLILNNDTDATRVLSYNPSNTTITFPGVAVRRVSANTTSPSQITSNQNDYNPTVAAVYRLSSDASRDITGWTAPSLDGTEIEVRNIGSFDIVFKHQSSSSTAANRFLNEIGLDIAIGANQGVKLRYDSTTARWRVSLLQ